MRLYHVSPRSNRDSILEHGLEPRDTTGPLGNFQTCATGLPDNAGLEAVYVTRRPRDWGGFFYDCPVDTWVIEAPRDLDAWDADSDPHWDGALRLRTVIPPNRLSLLTPDTAQDVPYADLTDSDLPL